MSVNPYESPTHARKRKANPTRTKRQVIRVVLGAVILLALIFLVLWIAAAVMVFCSPRGRHEYSVSHVQEIRTAAPLVPAILGEPPPDHFKI
jgi:peptidoglycan biosynthesis protein MviN/MurJ (putative lipid II flippase)